MASHIILIRQQLPAEVVGFIRRSTETYGKAKLLLRCVHYLMQAFDCCGGVTCITLLRHQAAAVEWMAD